MTENPSTPDQQPDPDAESGRAGGGTRPGDSGNAGRGFEPPAPPDGRAPVPPGWQAPPRQGWGSPADSGWGQPPGGPGPVPPPHGYPQAAYGQPVPGGPVGQPAGQWGYAPPPKPGVVPLRPLGIGDLLDGAFQGIRRNAGATLGLSVLVQLFAGVVSALLTLPLMSTLLSAESLTGDEPDFENLTGSLATMVGGSILAGLVAVLLMVVVQGAVTIPLLRAALNRRTSFGQALRIVRPSIGRLLLLALVYLAAGAVGLAVCTGIVVAVAVSSSSGAAFATAGIVLLLAVPTAVWIWVKLAFSVHAVVAESLPPFRAMARSFTLVRAGWWRCFGILLLTGLIVGVVTSLITTPLGFIGGIAGGLLAPDDPSAFADFMVKFGFVSTILSAVATGLGFAYQSAVSTLLYTDLRIRREGFDMALLREFDSGIDSDIPGLAAGPVPAGPAAPGNR